MSHYVILDDLDKCYTESYYCTVNLFVCKKQVHKSIDTNPKFVNYRT